MNFLTLMSLYDICSVEFLFPLKKIQLFEEISHLLCNLYVVN